MIVIIYQLVTALIELFMAIKLVIERWFS